MSRAFVKEDDGEDSERLPDRPVSSIPNYVTRSGLAALEQEAARLAEDRRALARDRNEPETARKLKEIERELRYFEARLETAKLVDHAAAPADEVRFGFTVELVDEAGRRMLYRIVGEDEADPERGALCWASPLADSLLSRRAGDSVVWKRPDGDRLLRIVSLRSC